MTEELNERMGTSGNFDADYEMYRVFHRENRMLRWGCGVLGLCLAASAGSAYMLSHRKPIILITRVSEIGQAQAIKYTSTEYTPSDADVRSGLYSWAKLRYTMNRATAGRDYMHNYYFLDEKLSGKEMEKDRASQKIAKILAGQGTVNELTINSVQIQSLGTTKRPDGTIAEGNAVIDLVKIFPGTGNEAKQERWTVSVNFTMNPEMAASRYAEDPTFQMVNPLGLTITFFHEDRAAA